MCHVAAFLCIAPSFLHHRNCLQFLLVLISSPFDLDWTILRVSSFFLERSGRKMLPNDVMKGGDFFTVGNNMFCPAIFFLFCFDELRRIK